MWHLSVSALSLGLALTVAAAPTPAQPKILRRLTPGANVISLSRTNSITDLETGQFNETFCMKGSNMQMRWHHPDLNVSVEQLQTTHARLFRRQAAQNTTITLTDIGPDLLWSGPVTVGSKTFNVDFDTGELPMICVLPDLDSQHLINVSAQAISIPKLFTDIGCTGPAAQCAGKNIYTPSQVSHIFLILNADLRHAYSVQSSTSAKTPNTFQISFGDGSAVRANVFTDTVSIGGLAITNSGVGAVTQLSQSFTNAGGDTSDGLMGMAFPVLAESKQTPYFSNLAKLSPTQGMMSFKFVGKNAPGSELTVGGMNTAAFTGHHHRSGPLTWGRRALAENRASQFATIDTGTSVVIAPQADAQAIYAAIPGSKLGQNGLFTYPCNANPDVALNFAGQNFNIKAADISHMYRTCRYLTFCYQVPQERVYCRICQTRARMDFGDGGARLTPLEEFTRLDDAVIAGIGTGTACPIEGWNYAAPPESGLYKAPWWALELFRNTTTPILISNTYHYDYRTSRLLTTAAYVDVPSRCTACSYVLTPPRSHGIVRKTASGEYLF
ncbi:Asp domain-containing protein [Rhizoctonia solani AG-1 IA]|uniref:Asp domain-containing protein n=1 Tax=Thanatephorus cucumeris (strain AG1-IA) TaxID=983506 RepID=L8WU24_THACA|nr:Asp domain-containing protein [Rhizoctonia solani AG-1 IA]